MSTNLGPNCVLISTRFAVVVVAWLDFDLTRLDYFAVAVRRGGGGRCDHEPLLPQPDAEEEPGSFAGHAVRHRPHHRGHEEGTGETRHE